MRCLTLARALRAKGFRCSFICRAHAGHLGSYLTEQGFETILLPFDDAELAQAIETPYESWLGAPWQSDAMWTRQIVNDSGVSPALLVVDHYAIEYRWEQAMRDSVDRIMVIDDRAQWTHDCDILLDQNYYAHMHRRYEDKLPEGCNTLLGPDFALIRAEYIAGRKLSTPRRGNVKRAIVYFGGTDQYRLAARFAQSFLEIAASDVTMHLVVPKNLADYERIGVLAETNSNIALVSQLPDFAEAFLTADIAIGAGGSTIWERMCMGLPSVLVSIAENQRQVCEDLAQEGYIAYLGASHMLTDGKIEAALRKYLCQPLRENWSEKCFSLCDGDGVARILNALGY